MQKITELNYWEIKLYYNFIYLLCSIKNEFQYPFISLDHNDGFGEVVELLLAAETRCRLYPSLLCEL
jgi:hypothetical protein